MEEYLKPVTRQSTKNILYQMDNSIYQIIKKGGKFETGIFCKIKLQNNTIPVFITSYHIIKEENIIKNNKINISINGELKTLELGEKKYIKLFTAALEDIDC